MTFTEFGAAVDDGVRNTLSKPVRDLVQLETTDKSATWSAATVAARIELVGTQGRMLRFIEFGTPDAGKERLGYEPLDGVAVAGFTQRVAAVLARAEIG